MGKTSLRISLTTKVVFQPNSWQGRFVSWIQYWESLTHRESLEFGGLMGNWSHNGYIMLQDSNQILTNNVNQCDMYCIIYNWYEPTYFRAVWPQTKRQVQRCPISRSLTDSITRKYHFRINSTLIGISVHHIGDMITVLAMGNLKNILAVALGWGLKTEPLDPKKLLSLVWWSSNLGKEFWEIPQRMTYI